MSRQSEPWTGGTDMEGGTYNDEAGGKEEPVASFLEPLLNYATQEPIEPPFPRSCVNEALITWWAIMSECFGETPPDPGATEEAMQKLRAFLLEGNTEQMIRRTYKKVAAVMDIHDLQAVIMVLRGLKILSKAVIVVGRTYAELGEVDSETLIAVEDDQTLIFALKSTRTGPIGPVDSETATHG